MSDNEVCKLGAEKAANEHDGATVETNEKKRQVESESEVNDFIFHCAALTD